MYEYILTCEIDPVTKQVVIRHKFMKTYEWK